MISIITFELGELLPLFRGTNSSPKHGHGIRHQRDPALQDRQQRPQLGFHGTVHPRCHHRIPVQRGVQVHGVLHGRPVRGRLQPVHHRRDDLESWDLTLARMWRRMSGHPLQRWSFLVRSNFHHPRVYYRELHGTTDHGNPAVTAVSPRIWGTGFDVYRRSGGIWDSYLEITIDYLGKTAGTEVIWTNSAVLPR